MSADVPVAAASHLGIRNVDRHAAVRSLVEREARPLLQYFARRTTSPEDAADLLGETLLVAWRRESSIPRDETEARMWMFGVARRVLSGHRRSQGRRTALTERLGSALSLASTPGADADADPDGLRAAIAALPELDRELVRLVYWDGFTLAEAGSILRMRPATARSRMSRARAKLRARLETD